MQLKALTAVILAYAAATAAAPVAGKSSLARVKRHIPLSTHLTRNIEPSTLDGIAKRDPQWNDWYNKRSVEKRDPQWNDWYNKRSEEKRDPQWNDWYNKRSEEKRDPQWNDWYNKREAAPAAAEA
jgi:hypothetical protein